MIKQTVKLDHTHTQKFGGLISYSKLIISIFSNKQFRLLNFYQKFRIIIEGIFQGFFKSFLYFFKIVEKLNGIYFFMDNKINTDQLNKKTIIYFLFIPIWFSNKKATIKDLLKRKIIND